MQRPISISYCHNCQNNIAKKNQIDPRKGCSRYSQVLLPRLSALPPEQRRRDGGALRAGGARAGTGTAGRAGGGDPAGRSRDGGRGFLPFPLSEPGRLKSAFVDGAAESASPGASPASARDSRSVKSSGRMAIVLRAAPAAPTLFPAA